MYFFVLIRFFVIFNNFFYIILYCIIEIFVWKYIIIKFVFNDLECVIFWFLVYVVKLLEFCLKKFLKCKWLFWLLVFFVSEVKFLWLYFFFLIIFLVI